MIYLGVFLDPERFFSRFTSRILERYNFQNFVIYKVFAQIHSVQEQQEDCFLKEVLKCFPVIAVTWKESYCHEDMVNSFYAINLGRIHNFVFLFRESERRRAKSFWSYSVREQSWDQMHQEDNNNLISNGADFFFCKCSLFWGIYQR